MDIDGYLASLSLRTSSPETLRAYRQTLSRFEDFIRSEGIRVTQVKPTTITAFINQLSEQKGRTVGESLAPATIARHLAVLSSFFDVLNHNSDGKIRNPVQLVKRPKVSNDLPRAVEDDTLRTLVNGITVPRDKAIILLFIYSGLRLSELHNLNRDSIIPKMRTAPDGRVTYFGYCEVVGKGKKRRDIRVGARALVALSEYDVQRGDDANPALFICSSGDRLSCRTIQQILDKWCKRLNISHIHIHQLRHSFATRNVNAGMSLAVLQSFMGHAHPDTTGRYFRIRPERKTREYFAAMEYVDQTSRV
ncbi:MAG: tyrosine-type recombinase/integrase [Terriglobales bacterium]